MSNMIATQLSVRTKLLKGDLPKSGAEIATPLGQPLPMVAKPRRPPPGLSVPLPFGSQGRLPASQGLGDFGTLGEVVTQLNASIVGCHRETVRRETGLDNCPSSNLHQFVPQVPHSRHEFIHPSIKLTLDRGNSVHILPYKNQISPRFL